MSTGAWNIPAAPDSTGKSVSQCGARNVVSFSPPESDVEH